MFWSSELELVMSDHFLWLGGGNSSVLPVLVWNWFILLDQSQPSDVRDGRRDQRESSESLITGAAVHSLLANWSIIQIVTTLTAAFTITAGLLSPYRSLPVVRLLHLHVRIIILVNTINTHLKAPITPSLLVNISSHWHALPAPHALWFMNVRVTPCLALQAWTRPEQMLWVMGVRMDTRLSIQAA